MNPLHTARTAFLLGIAAILAGAPARAEPPVGTDDPGRSATVADCTGAAAADVHLDGRARVDGFVVDLGRRAGAGTTRVRVRAGRFERVLHVTGAGARGLRFRPALEADRFTVTLEPIDSEPGACLERVTLLEGTAQVAVVQP